MSNVAGVKSTLFLKLFFSFWKYLIKKYQVRLEDMNLNYEGNEGFLKRVTHGL